VSLWRRGGASDFLLIPQRRKRTLMAQTSEKMTPEDSISIGFSCNSMPVYRKMARDISFHLRSAWRLARTAVLFVSSIDFGVEVKVPEPRKARAGKGGQVLWQSIIYSQSRFKVPKKPEEAGLANKTCVVLRPAFILIFPRLLNFFSSPELGFAFEAFAQQANVGSLDVLDGGWIMVGGTNYYFSRRSGELKLSTPNCLLKRNVGSKK
jgi:hypothetical protein